MPAIPLSLARKECQAILADFRDRDAPPFSFAPPQRPRTAFREFRPILILFLVS